MKPIHCAALAAVLYALLPLPARAQWQASIGAGARRAAHVEYDLAGRQLVREDGWLPGTSVRAARQLGDLTWVGGADWYQGGIDYRGRTQAGAAAVSTTSTRLISARMGASYAFGPYSILAALEIDRWQRDILGTAAGSGLQETYWSRRVLLGSGKTWRPAVGAVSAEAALVLAAPERMRIGFSGLFDPVSLETRRGRGLRLGADLRPAGASFLQLHGRVDWLKVARSGEAALTADGAFRGTVTQPEHARKTLTLELATVF